MDSRIKSLNEIIEYDDSKREHEVDPSILKIDYFTEYIRNYLELGIAYLEGDVQEKDIPMQMENRAEKIRHLHLFNLFNESTDGVFVMGAVKMKDHEGIRESLCFRDGTHRTIWALFNMKEEDRYHDDVKPKSIDDLINWSHKNYENDLYDASLKLVKNKNGFFVNPNPKKM